MAYQNFSYEGKRYQQISKPKAQRLISEGYYIYLLPAKANIGSPYVSFMRLPALAKNFNKLVNSFEYYNCRAPFGSYAIFFYCTTDKPKVARQLKLTFNL